MEKLSLGEPEPGKHETLKEISGLPNGLVVCTLMVDGEVIGRVKVVVDKQAQHN